MSSQYPEDPSTRAGGPFRDNEPVDPWADGRRLPAPPPPPAPAEYQPPGYSSNDQPGDPRNGSGQERYPQPGGHAGYGHPGHGQQGYPQQAYQRPGYQQRAYPQHGYQPYGYQAYGYRPYAVAPKSPGLALLASFFIPGLGSMLNGDVGKGIGILVGYVASAVLTIVLIGYAGLLAFWVWGMVDAYSGAQRWNARHGILS